MNSSLSGLFQSNLFKANATYIVGCSGGPDSTFLLNQLLKLDLPINLIVAHVNYHKRTTSNRDRDLIKNFCLKNKVVFCEKNVNQHVYHQNLKSNFQALAREIRFNYFCALVKKFQALGIILGHQLNDVIETFIMQKKRKGQVNIWGLAPISTYNYQKTEVSVLRPMLKIKKSEILAYLDKNKIPYGIDESNFESIYQRNALRLTLKEIDFIQYQKEIIIANHELALDIKAARGAIIKNAINLNLYQKLTLAQQKRSIYLLLKQNCAEALINKKSKIISEINKQFNTEKKRVFIFNNHIYLKKTNDKIIVVLK